MTTAIINKAWNWRGFNATKIIQTNDFGNVIFQTDKNEFWRICPEELSCEKIAQNENDYKKLLSDEEFLEDWEMTNLVNAANEKLGDLNKDEKYCLKMSPILGGEYNMDNLGKISFSEMILFSGDIGFQIKDLKDGQKIKLEIK